MRLLPVTAAIGDRRTIFISIVMKTSDCRGWSSQLFIDRYEIPDFSTQSARASSEF
jgi:hypothetical protein